MEVKKFLQVSKKDAVLAGLPRYFTGKPCKRGHISERRTSTNDCVECSKLRQKTDRLRQYKMSYYAENKEKTLENAKENYMKNREKKFHTRLSTSGSTPKKSTRETRLHFWKKSRTHLG